MPEQSYLATNPLHGNPLKSRDDMQQAIRSVFEPLLPYFSPGGARVQLGATAAFYSSAAAELEGFARPFWGLGPLAAGGGAFDHWDLIRRGFVNGCDPNHPEYWGTVVGRGQQIVESASLGFALAMAPEHIWDPLSPDQQQKIGDWMERIIDLETPPTNWHFFPVMVALGMERVGRPVDWSRLEHRFEAIESYYVADGWYRDGPGRRLDHYIAFAIHFLSLIYAKLRKGDDARRQLYKDRAVTYAKDFKLWYASDGAALPFGRSLTYRFAHAGFWGSLAFADVEALPWGEIKGLLFSNLRWWRDQPIADRDGVLSLGYGYPNLLMSEGYNSPGSPYWAAKAFLPLSLPEEHPFWQAEEIPPQAPKSTVSHSIPGMVIYGEPGNTTALITGQEHHRLRRGPEKYSKFAYSTRYAFSVESYDNGFPTGAFDSMLALSAQERYYRFRTVNEVAKINGNTLYSKWLPWPDVEVETWLIAQAPWHLRIHRILSPRPLESVEGGFAVALMDANVIERIEADGLAAAQTKTDFSGIRWLEGSTQREGVVVAPPPNTNLIFPRSLVPHLRADVPAGETTLAAAILASPDVDKALIDWNDPPALPDAGELNRRRDQATIVPGWAQ